MFLTPHLMFVDCVDMSARSEYPLHANPIWRQVHMYPRITGAILELQHQFRILHRIVRLCTAAEKSGENFYIHHDVLHCFLGLGYGVVHLRQRRHSRSLPKVKPTQTISLIRSRSKGKKKRRRKTGKRTARLGTVAFQQVRPIAY